jgi:methylmalonyl-CoA mutase
VAAPTLADWRALVEKDGTSVDKLIADGVQPLYVAASATHGVLAPAGRFQVCMRVDAPAKRRPGALLEDLDGGADALWCDLTDHEAIDAANARGKLVIVELPPASDDPPPDERDAGDRKTATRQWVGFDYMSEVFLGRGAVALIDLTLLVRSLPALLKGLPPEMRCLRVGSVAFHDAGADAADELALMLASAVAYLRPFADPAVAASRMWTQIAVGRDTFGEVCKLRALRLLFGKLFAAIGADVPAPPIHAVCSARTQAQRDPWVNMLRVTTEVFAAALGGADVITPRAFDETGVPRGVIDDGDAAFGRRVARNAALVLRDESHLGAVADPGGGSYYLETRTDQLAREAWTRFQAIEAAGGIAKLVANGELAKRLEASWTKRAALIAKRKEPVLGVSEFANLDERLPPMPAPAANLHRDSEAFETLRASAPRDVALVTLGTASEYRGRTGFATALFAVGGQRVRETAELATACDVACICGSDERYATEAAAAARALKSAGAKRVVLAGRPGALEADLRAAGVDDFMYVGCDVVAFLGGVLA